MTDRTPTTAAGRRLLATFETGNRTNNSYRAVILAIEAEARAPLDVLMGVWTCASPTQPDATVVAYTRPILLRATQDRRTSVVISGYQWDFAALEEPTP